MANKDPLKSIRNIAPDSKKAQVMANQAAVTANKLGIAEQETRRIIQEILQGSLLTYKEINEVLADQASILSDTYDTNVKIEARAKRKLDITTKLELAETNIVDAMQKASGTLTDNLRLTERQLSTIEKLSKESLKVNKGDKERVTLLHDMAKSLQEHVATIRIMQARNKTMGGHLHNVVESSDKIAENAKEYLPSWVHSSVDKLNEKMKNVLLTGGGISLAAAAFGAALLGAFVVLMKVQHQSQEIAKNTGLSIEQSHELVMSSYELQSSSANYLSTQKEIVETQQALMGEFRNFHKISADTVVQIANLSNAFGYSAENAAKVQGIFEVIGGSTADMAIDLQAAVGSLSEAAGVAPGEVIKDIAANAGVASKYFAGQPAMLAKAAIQLHKIGLSLSDAAASAEALLTIETSLAAQYTASAMIGRQINLDKSRELMLQGKIAEGQASALESVGSYAEYEKLLPIQRKALADAIGLTTDKLQTAMWLQEATKDMSAEELDLTTKYGEQLGNINGLGKEQIIDRAKHVQLTEQLTSSFEKLASSIMPTLITLSSALSPILQAISFIVNNIASGIQLIVDGWNSMPGIVKIAAAALGTALLVMKALTLELKIQAMLQMAKAAFASPVGAVAAMGLVLVLGGMLRNATKVDDAVIQPQSTAGYSRVMSGPEGSVAFNDKDTIVAGTNLNSGNSSSDNSKLERLLQENNNLLRQSLNRPIIIGREAVNAIGNSIKVNNTFG